MNPDRSLNKIFSSRFKVLCPEMDQFSNNIADFGIHVEDLDFDDYLLEFYPTPGLEPKRVLRFYRFAVLPNSSSALLMVTSAILCNLLFPLNLVIRLVYPFIILWYRSNIG